MRSRLIKALLTSAFAYGLAGAQPMLLEANVPFDFHVGDALLHAGVYRIEANHTLLTVRNRSKGFGAFRLVLPGTRRSGQLDSKLVFTEYNGDYELTSVWTAGSTEGEVLPPTRRQRELEVASALHKSTQVPLIALR